MSASAAAGAEPGRLTQGPISRHVIAMAVPVAVGMVFQTLYFLIDLYFVGHIGDAAIAGVGAAGNVTFLVIALTQVLAAGTVALVAQAIGRRDLADANLIFNQSVSIAAAFALAILLFGYLLTPVYMRTLGADPATADAGISYLYWYLPGLALQFALVAMNSALRGTGIVKPTMLVQVFTVVINALLAPVLIAGWGTGRALGVAGAGLASTIAVAVGVAMLWFYFYRLEHDVSYDPALVRPQRAAWRRILRIGAPAGFEFLMLFAILATIYAAIRQFGAEAQAGFGVGNRINQALFLPVMAVAFATAPVAGQNFGASLHDRVRETFRFAALLSSALMVLMMVVCEWRPESLVRIFTKEAAVVDAGRQFLQVIAWNYVAAGLIFTCSSMFQALGNTLPSLLSSLSRLVTFVLPVALLSRWPGFQLHHVWLLSVATNNLQAVLSLALLYREFRHKLRPAQLSPGT